MKKILVLLINITSCQILSAQIKEGKIIYEQKIDMHRHIPADNVQMRSMVPASRISKFDLYFGDNQSLYERIEDEPDLTESNNNGMVIRMGTPGAVTYRNFSTLNVVEQRELAEKEYLIEDSLKSFPWKLSDETKDILGYICKKATGKTLERGLEVEAWYTEQILVSSGPDAFNGLPGMILKVDVNKQEFVYTATEVINTVNKKEIKAPSKGKKISRGDFVKLRQELFGDQSGPIRIVTN